MEIKSFLRNIVSNAGKHARWLNTLSLMENTGARKISAGEHPIDTTLLVLKHAAEEHRHAYYLKKQIAKLSSNACSTYANEFLIAPIESRHYLHQLDVMTCKYLKAYLGYQGKALKFSAYLLVTYAIELRADQLYPLYQEVLQEAKSNVNVKSIILEEEGHLEEMHHQLNGFFEDWKPHAHKVVEIESLLFSQWLQAMEKEVSMESF